MVWAFLAGLATGPLVWGQASGLGRASPFAGQTAKADEGTPPAQPSPESDAAQTGAVVVEVGGRVDRSLFPPKGPASAEAVNGETPAGVERADGPSPVAPMLAAPTAWKPVEKGEFLPTGSWLRTGFSSFVTLRFGENEYVSIRHLTLASVDDFRPMPGGDRIRIGLGYGTVRGGSADHALRSDLAVEAPTATLAKRGTEGWEIRVEPGTGRYRISLARSGLVEALEQARRGAGRLVRPGEYVTQDTLAGLWIQQAQFDRMAGVYKLEGMTGADERFALKNTSGLGFINPGGGEELYALNNRGEPSALRNPVSAALAAGTRPNLRFGVIDSPVGNFGSPGVLNSSPNP